MSPKGAIGIPSADQQNDDRTLVPTIHLIPSIFSSKGGRFCCCTYVDGQASSLTGVQGKIQEPSRIVEELMRSTRLGAARLSPNLSWIVTSGAFLRSCVLDPRDIWQQVSEGYKHCFAPQFCLGSHDSEVSDMLPCDSAGGLMWTQ